MAEVAHPRGSVTIDAETYDNLKAAARQGWAGVKGVAAAGATGLVNYYQAPDPVIPVFSLLVTGVGVLGISSSWITDIKTVKENPWIAPVALFGLGAYIRKKGNADPLTGMPVRTNLQSQGLMLMAAGLAIFVLYLKGVYEEKQKKEAAAAKQPAAPAGGTSPSLPPKTTAGFDTGAEDLSNRWLQLPNGSFVRLTDEQTREKRNADAAVQHARVIFSQAAAA